jgi:hypothetical protein
VAEVSQPSTYRRDRELFDAVAELHRFYDYWPRWSMVGDADTDVLVGESDYRREVSHATWVVMLRISQRQAFRAVKEMPGSAHYRAAAAAARRARPGYQPMAAEARERLRAAREQRGGSPRR